MTKHEFINGIRSLYNIDGWQLPELRAEGYDLFRLEPARYLILTSDKEAEAIWREVEKRQPTAKMQRVADAVVSGDGLFEAAADLCRPGDVESGGVT